MFDGWLSRINHDDGDNPIDYNLGDDVLGGGDTQITEYTWDHRNRLTRVTSRTVFGGPATKTIDYTYDALNQLVSRVVDPDGDTGNADIDQAFYLYDQGQVVLEFQKGGEGEAEADDLAHRYLWNPAAVDQLLADEQVHWSGSAAEVGETFWALTDHLGTVRDLIDNNGTVRKHIAYDAFGNITDESYRDMAGFETAPPDDQAASQLFYFTGRFLDRETGLQNNLHRWYDASTGRWISEDPIGFGGGDANLTRYVGNSPTMYTDPSGLFWGEVWAGVKGLGQGVCNVANAATDTAIGVANTPAFVWNNTAGWVAPNAPYIPSPDWSNGLITDEGGLHGWSKGAGAVGIGAGLGAYGAARAAVARAAGAGAAAEAAAAGRGLDDILGNADTCKSFFKRSFPSDRPFSVDDSRKIWDKLNELGKNPRLDAGHPGTQWPGPHINIPGPGGTHIPVDPGFIP